MARLPGNVRDDAAAVLVLQSEILQPGELSLRHGQQLAVVEYVRQGQLPSLRHQISSIQLKEKYKKFNLKVTLLGQKIFQPCEPPATIKLPPHPTLPVLLLALYRGFFKFSPH